MRNCYNGIVMIDLLYPNIKTISVTSFWIFLKAEIDFFILKEYLKKIRIFCFFKLQLLNVSMKSQVCRIIDYLPQMSSKNSNKKLKGHFC